MHGPAALIVNGRSRLGRDLWKVVTATFQSEGVELVLQCLAKSESDLQSAISHCKTLGVRSLFVGGGDGTQSLAAQELAHTDVRLGVIPLGTGNALARDLGIPNDAVAAVQALLKGEPYEIDLGSADSKIFVNVATLGMTASVVRALNKESKKRFGKMAYLFPAIRALVTMRPFWVDVRTADAAYSGKAVQFVCGCGVYHAGPFRISSQACQSNGKLSIYVLPSQGRGSVIKFAYHLLLRRQADVAGVWSIEAEKASIESKPIKSVVVDGELKGRTPLEVKVLPGALRVLKPRTFE
jgi:YegS/Rv2252/BmrU family lipid kinase